VLKTLGQEALGQEAYEAYAGAAGAVSAKWASDQWHAKPKVMKDLWEAAAERVMRLTLNSMDETPTVRLEVGGVTIAEPSGAYASYAPINGRKLLS
jgi:hypothetical protein